MSTQPQRHPERERSRSLAKAAAKGKVDKLRRALDAGGSPDTVGPSSQPALLHASKGGHLGCVRLLLQRGATVDIKSGDGTTALMLACLNGHPHVVQELLAKGADVQMRDRRCGWTAVTWCNGWGGAARTEGCVNSAIMLLEHGAMPEGLGNACTYGPLKMVQLLLAYGADRRAVPLHRNKPEVQQWLVDTQQLKAPLQYLHAMPPARAARLLRAGASIEQHAASPSPLDIARDLKQHGLAQEGSAADLVLRASKPWSPATHTLFPAPARKYACDVLRLAYLIRMRHLPTGPPAHDFAMDLLQHTVTRDIYTAHDATCEQER